MKRCDWAESSDLMREYHDTEWGVECRDDNKLFEMLVLETMQAGLSWSTILQKREALREVFFQFDPVKVSQMGEDDVARLMQDERIIRYEPKIRSVISNAQAFLRIQEEFGSFSTYQWSFVNDTPIINSFSTMSDLPSKTDISTAFAKDLKKRGITFIGPVTAYAHMQACGMVVDHLETCFLSQ